MSKCFAESKSGTYKLKTRASFLLQEIILSCHIRMSPHNKNTTCYLLKIYRHNNIVLRKDKKTMRYQLKL